RRGGRRAPRIAPRRRSTFDQALGAQLGEERLHVAHDRAVAVVEALRKARRDVARGTARGDFLHHGGGRGGERVHLLALRLEQHAAELLLAELHEFGQSHGALPSPKSYWGGGGMSTTLTVGRKDGSRSAICPCRAKSIDSPRMRAPSCGAW